MSAEGMGFVAADPPVIRVAVAADQNLVAESVRAALVHRGYEALAVRWPSVDEAAGHPAPPRRPYRPGSVGPPPDVALLLSELSKIAQIRAAQTLLAGLGVPWLVLAGVPSGPAWGAVYERGAAVVVSTDIGLDTLCDLVDDLYVGHTPPEAERHRDLVRAWRSFAQQRGELTARIDSLTGREEEVLHQLHLGMAVRAIAEMGEVSEATVRSQVKAILRKLEVNSQIAAVAAYEELYSNSSMRTGPSGRGSVTA